jgi:hypothetical protein
MTFFTQVTANPNATQETLKSLSGTGSWYTYYTPAGIFETRGEALKANNCGRDALESRCSRDSFPEWRRELKSQFADVREAYVQNPKRKINAEISRAVTGKPVMTYYGLYPSVSAVAQAAGVFTSDVRRWIKNYPEHYYYVV